MGAGPQCLAGPGPSLSTTAPPTGRPTWRGAWVRRSCRPPERGYGAACHAGLLAASAPLVAFMDCDASLDPRQLSRLVAAISDRGNDSRDSHDLRDSGGNSASAAEDAGAGQLVVGRRMPLSRGGVAMAPARRQPGGSPSAEPANRVAPQGRRADAVGPHRRSAHAGHRRPPVGVSARDRRSSGRRRAGGSPRSRSTTTPRTGRSKVTGTPLGAARTVRDMSKVLAR